MSSRTARALTPDDLPPPPPGKTGWPWTEGTPLPRTTAGVEWPRITIVTPSYNQAAYLEETIRSVLLQAYPDLEYFIIDGGSTDESADIIARYEEYLAGWVSERDDGQSHALNKGFAQATGQVLAYLNSDDRYQPGALHAVADSFRQGSEWVVGQVRCWRDGERSWPFPRLPGRSFTRWLVSCPVGQPGSFWSARLHDAAGPFREDLRFVMDYEMWLRLRFDHGIEPTWLRQTLAMYRLHEESKTVALTAEFGRELADAVARVETGLTPLQRMRLRGARRQRRATRLGKDAIMRFKRGEYATATRQLSAAFRVWPALAIGRAPFLGVKALLTDLRDPLPFPEMWPV